MNLATVFARNDKVVYGKAFDVVKCTKTVDFSRESDIANKLDSITVYEVKSTNRKKLGRDFSNYFFDLTTAELLVAQSLGEQFKFAFVNTVTERHIEMSLPQVLARARKLYPKWAVLF